jgi:2-iminobutanoate/2-iminopropanoate deaminase
MKKIEVQAPGMLNEAYDYAKPSAFSRGLKIELPSPATLIYISGTASVDENGESIHIGDIKTQTIRTFSNITALLQSAGATWKDVVKTTVYLKDIKRDYEVFNEIRCRFYEEQGLSPYPASTCVQAQLCRDELFVEIEAQAIIQKS